MKENFSAKRKAHLLNMLIENVLHVDKAEAEIWTTAMEQLVKVEKGVAGFEGGPSLKINPV